MVMGRAYKTPLMTTDGPHVSPLEDHTTIQLSNIVYFISVPFVSNICYYLDLDMYLDTSANAKNKPT